MRKRTWQKSKSSLRALLKDFKENVVIKGDYSDLYNYKFGITFNARTRSFHLYNGLSRNVVCTFRISYDRIYIRYRPKSFYKYEIMKFDVEDKEIFFIPSDNLGRFRNSIDNRLYSTTYENLLLDTASRSLPVSEEQEISVEYAYSVAMRPSDFWSRETIDSISRQQLADYERRQMHYDRLRRTVPIDAETASTIERALADIPTTQDSENCGCRDCTLSNDEIEQEYRIQNPFELRL